ncbi:hypothetical protein RFI_03159 [Reticulomyxa filosa]|uniref:Uncharacterized protein n=1 Tax=Reticulomyxa filosa TaxID=46433 RepID=X6P8H1_RETFI|nr:hypothetical protein RFI_03159 [Reticulomyxa filosa]|eukprot:ETO33937.1 hypothetical protein RFI_03159 [Reticulomyxa filosa]
MLVTPIWRDLTIRKYCHYLNNYEIHSKRGFYCFFGFENKKKISLYVGFFFFLYCVCIIDESTKIGFFKKRKDYIIKVLFYFLFICIKMRKINLNIHEIIVMKKNGQDIVQIIGKKMSNTTSSKVLKKKMDPIEKKMDHNEQKMDSSEKRMDSSEKKKFEQQQQRHCN